MAGKDKEAIVICLDVSSSMDQAAPGFVSQLESSLDVITLILQRKVFAESKDEVSLILFGTAGTANHLAKDGEYEYITEARPMAPVDLDLIEYVKKEITPGPASADCVDVLVVALDLLHTALNGGKFTSSRVIVFSNLAGAFSDNKLEQVIGGIKNLGADVNLIGPNLEDDEEEDVDSAPNGSQEAGPSTSSGRRGHRQPHQKEKTPQQRAGEKLMKHILDEVQGEHYGIHEVLPLLSFFEKKAVRQTPWKINLEIGSEMKIPVCGYLKVKESTVKSWKSIYIKGKGKEYKPQTIRSQHLNNDEETEVEKEDHVEGFRYGSDIIPISEDDKKNMGYQNPGKVLQVLGFTKQENIKRQHYMGNSVYCFAADPNDQHSGVALSALINALYETNMVIIVRRAYSRASSPKLGFLSPHIKAKYESLMYTELPFMEDIRQYTFASLTKSKKHQPTDTQLSAVDDLIDGMDLTKTKEDEDDEEEEALKPKVTCNPLSQRLCHCLMHRALNPDDPLPDIQEVIANYLQPPRALAAECEPHVDKLKELFKLEVVKKKEETVGDSLWKDSDTNQAGPAAKKAKVEDGGDAGDFSMAGLAKGAVTEVGTVDPVGDFKKIISNKDEDKFQEASRQMQDRIDQLVRDSFGSTFYAKALDCLKVLRQESTQLGEPEQFNTFLRKLKDDLQQNFKKGFWQEIVKAGLTLIASGESIESSVTKEEAKQFLEEAEDKKDDEPPPQADEDADDLLDMMA